MNLRRIRRTPTCSTTAKLFPCSQCDNTRIIGLTLDDIKKIRRVVGVAGGTSKREAIRAALLRKLGM